MTPASSDTCYPPDIRPLWNALPQPALRTATGMRAGTSQLPAGRAVIDRRWMVQAIIRAKQGHDWPDGPYLIDQSLHHGVLLAAAVVPRGSAGRTTGSGVPTTHDLMKDPTVPPRQDTTISDGPDRVADPVPSLPPLRGYQQEAVDAVAAGLAASGRGLVVAACGTGKTLVAVHAAVRLAPTGLIVVACPSLALLAQTLQVWSGCGLAAETLAVCSDDTVADAAVHVSDLDCPVTTAPEEITEWVRRTATTRLRLFLTTHASAGVARPPSPKCCPWTTPRCSAPSATTTRSPRPSPTAGSTTTGSWSSASPAPRSCPCCAGPMIAPSSTAPGRRCVPRWCRPRWPGPPSSSGCVASWCSPRASPSRKSSPSPWPAPWRRCLRSNGPKGGSPSATWTARRPPRGGNGISRTWLTRPRTGGRCCLTPAAWAKASMCPPWTGSRSPGRNGRRPTWCRRSAGRCGATRAGRASPPCWCRCCCQMTQPTCSKRIWPSGPPCCRSCAPCAPTTAAWPSTWTPSG